MQNWISNSRKRLNGSVNYLLANTEESLKLFIVALIWNCEASLQNSFWKFWALFNFLQLCHMLPLLLFERFVPDKIFLQNSAVWWTFIIYRYRFWKIFSNNCFCKNSMNWNDCMLLRIMLRKLSEFQILHNNWFWQSLPLTF